MLKSNEKIWDHERQRRNRKLERAASALGASLRDKVVPADKAVQLLEAVIAPGDRVCLEGNNQKQADFLAQALTRVDPTQVNKLHMLQSVRCPSISICTSSASQSNWTSPAHRPRGWRA